MKLCRIVKTIKQLTLLGRCVDDAEIILKYLSGRMEFTLLFLTKLFNILPIIFKLCLSEKTNSSINFDNIVLNIKT